MSTLSVQEKSKRAEDSRPNRNIFQDPAIAEAGKNDPFVRFVARNWRIILVALVSIGLSMIAYNRFMATAEQRRADATQLLLDVQGGYQDLIDKQEALATLKSAERVATDPKERIAAADKVKSQTEEIRRLQEKLGHMLVGLDSPSHFGLLGDFYKGLLAARFGDFSATQTALGSTNWEQVGKPDSPERFAAEFVTFGLAKALVDSDQHIDSAKAALTALADRGSFSAAQAVDVLAILATSSEEKEKVRGLIHGVEQRFPAQQKFLTDAAERVAS